MVSAVATLAHFTVWVFGLTDEVLVLTSISGGRSRGGGEVGVVELPWRAGHDYRSLAFLLDKNTAVPAGSLFATDVVVTDTSGGAKLLGKPQQLQQGHPVLLLVPGGGQVVDKV